MNKSKYSIILFSILFVTAILSIRAKQKDNENFLSKIGFTGNIESITIREYNVSGDTSNYVKGTLKFKSKLVFDKFGNLIERTKYGTDFEIVNIETYKYNKRNQVIQNCAYSPNEILISKSIVDYGKKGIKTSFKEYNSRGKLLDYRKYNADKNGNIVESYSAIGSVFPRIISKYNSKNNLKEEKIMKSFNNIRYNYYKYDKNGYVVQELKLKSNGSIESKFKARYDKKGNQVSKITFDEEDRIVEKVVSQYDNKKNVIEENYFYPDGNFKYRVNIFYDKFENSTVYKYTGYYNDQYDYKYIYDKRENIICTIIFYAGTAESLEEIEIIYF